MTAEARVIINALGLMESREMQEQWLATYLLAREARTRQIRRVFTKTDPTTLASGSSSSSPAL